MCALIVAVWLSLPFGGEIELPIGYPVASTDSYHLVSLGHIEYIIEDEDVLCGE
jgi:hypothetical protein